MRTRHSFGLKAKILTSSTLVLLWQLIIAGVSIYRAPHTADMMLLQGLAIGGLVLGLSFSLRVSHRTLKQLSQVTRSLSTGANEVSSSSHEMLETSERLDATAGMELEALAETEHLVRTMTHMVQSNADRAASSQKLTDTSRAMVLQGTTAVKDVVAVLEQIDATQGEIINQMERSLAEVSLLTKAIQEIEGKTKIINEIGFRTHLLSFNASIEAARAGAQGQGFAVVASEVRSLAQVSGKAAQEISDMFAQSISNTQKTLNDSRARVTSLVAQSRERMKRGAETALKCADLLSKVSNDVTDASTITTEIEKASRDQANCIVRINEAIVKLDQLSHESKTASRRTTQVSERLSARAGAFQQSVLLLLQTMTGNRFEVFLKSLTAQTTMVREYLDAMDSSRGGSPEMMQSVGRLMKSIHKSCEALYLPHLTQITSLALEIIQLSAGVKSGTARNKSQATLLDALTTMKYMVENFDKATSEEQTLLLTRMKSVTDELRGKSSAVVPADRAA